MAASPSSERRVRWIRRRCNIRQEACLEGPKRVSVASQEPRWPRYKRRQRKIIQIQIVWDSDSDGDGDISVQQLQFKIGLDWIRAQPPRRRDETKMGSNPLRKDANADFIWAWCTCTAAEAWRWGIRNSNTRQLEGQDRTRQDISVDVDAETKPDPGRRAGGVHLLRRCRDQGQGQDICTACRRPREERETIWSLKAGTANCRAEVCAEYAVVSLGSLHGVKIQSDKCTLHFEIRTTQASVYSTNENISQQNVKAAQNSIKSLIRMERKKANLVMVADQRLQLERACGPERRAETGNCRERRKSNFEDKGLGTKSHPKMNSDVSLTRRNPYVDMIKRQLKKFPKGLNLSKINISDMQKLLLDPQNGFTIHVVEPTGTSPGPEDTVQNTPQDVQRDVRPVQLLIQDQRARSFELNVAQRVNLNLFDATECRNNEWRASSTELFNELQASVGRLEGSGRMGIPDRQKPKYTEYFVVFDVEEGNNIFAANLSNIVIPDGNRLELRVNDIKNKRLRTASPDPQLGSQSAGPSTIKPSTVLDSGVSWLRETIEKCSGYAKFDSNRGKVLPNADRVEFWRFAAQVATTFHKTSWPTEILSTTKISKEAIEKALRIGSTSLNDAITMIRIIDSHTADGPNRSEEVIAEVSKS
ncbi:hypothetical protein B0H14DRAFT_3167048 [Mycena olivaceomarginata]|nr:hypothetical protein B0H14DRAFT_3167048 [Mycena olivaceomarginata]